MSRNLALPYFALPPAEYDQRYFSELVRSFTVYLAQQQNPGEGRNTGLVLTALQTDDSGLETGALFQQQGFVKIVLINTPHVRGSSGTGEVGLVTVVTT
ncbi:MAG: hypothetical protein CMJ25_25215 [Phycisphaerae bacterium]|nr:hypothetical protein [Phycisphaerae bacterium]